MSDCPVKTASITLTDAQIKALSTTPVTVVPAPGAGKAILLVGAHLIPNFAAGTYTNVTAGNSYVYLASANNASLHQDVDAAVLFQERSTAVVLTVLPGHGTVFEVFDLENFALQIRALNGDGDYTGGNSANTLKVVVYYVELDV